mgnify:CR=1 FL=1
MNTLTQFLAGKRTYLVASIAIAYLLYCQQTKQTPDETILGIFGALGVAALRAGIPATGSVTKTESNGAGYPFPPQTPRADTNGITRTFPCILACLMVFGLTGCTSPGTLTEAKVAIVDGKKSIKLGSHKDTIIEEFERSPDGTIRINGSSVGKIESDGTVRKDGSSVGKVESDGTIRKNGSSVGKIEPDGTFRKDGSSIGQIESGGTIRKNGSSWGSASNCCGDHGSKRSVAALLVFFSDLF